MALDIILKRQLGYTRNDNLRSKLKKSMTYKKNFSKYNELRG